MLRATKPRRFIGQIRDLWREWREVKQLEKESVQNRLTEIRQKTTEAHATLKLLDEKMAEMNPKNEKEALRLVREHVGKMKTVSDALDKQAAQTRELFNQEFDKLVAEMEKNDAKSGLDKPK